MDQISNSTGESSLVSLLSLFDDEESRWQAIQTRDPDADGFFVYAVKTTKIFCRPICKARLARRANVRFYETVDEAESAGFRACKRCKPGLAGFMPEEAAVRKIKAFIAGQDEELLAGSTTVSLGQMARQTGLSKWHFHRVFKKQVGVTPVEYLKMKKAGSSLEAGNLPNAPMGATRGAETFGMTEPVENGDQWAIATPPTVGIGEWSPLTFDDFLIWPADNASNADVVTS